MNLLLLAQTALYKMLVQTYISVNVTGKLMFLWLANKPVSGSGYGLVASCCEYGNALSGSIKCEEFLD
jgi:hypothetical protein